MCRYIWGSRGGVKTPKSHTASDDGPFVSITFICPLSQKMPKERTPKQSRHILILPHFCGILSHLQADSSLGFSHASGCISALSLTGLDGVFFHAVPNCFLNLFITSQSVLLQWNPWFNYALREQALLCVNLLDDHFIWYSLDLV